MFFSYFTNIFIKNIKNQRKALEEKKNETEILTLNLKEEFQKEKQKLVITIHLEKKLNFQNLEMSHIAII